MPHFQPYICCRSTHSWTDLTEGGMRERVEAGGEGGNCETAVSAASKPWLSHHSGWMAKGLKTDGPAPSPALAIPLPPAFVLAQVSLASKPSFGLLSFQLNFFWKYVARAMQSQSHRCLVQRQITSFSSLLTMLLPISPRIALFCFTNTHHSLEHQISQSWHQKNFQRWFQHYWRWSHCSGCWSA